MTARRSMTRSFSGNGRTSSFSEEEGGSSNGRSESRNTYLSNVRPENRSTLCSVMAQLTEDIQPSFETTLKSKAVSENCNVKFSCVVSGYPVPELKWYKDDMEMDRYCGLPKYEICRKGKTHTLHIYNCTLDDAAIYQVSASNCKGIVSCSGVLEVGTMNEYKIHQRFFEKLKQKAEKKKKDLEVKMDGKENIQKEQRRSPDHPQRKRSVPPTAVKADVNKSVAVEHPGDLAEPNAVSSGLTDEVDLTSENNSLESDASASEETLAKKRLKMSNGVDVGVNSSSGNSNHLMANGGENCYDGGISLAHFMAETLQSQATEENQIPPEEEKPQDMETNVGDMEEVQNKLEKQLEKELEKDKMQERQVEVKHGKQSAEGKHHSKGHKDHDHHNIQASISSMLHTVKDFFFGKNKKDSHSHCENEDIDLDMQSPELDLPPSFQLRVEHNPETHQEVVPDKTQEPSETMDTEQCSAPPEDSNLKTDFQPEYKPLPKTEEESKSKQDNAEEAMDVSVQPDSEAEEKNSITVSVFKGGLTQKPESDFPQVLQEPKHQVGEDDSSAKEDKSVTSQSQAPSDEGRPLPPTFSKPKSCWISPHDISGAKSQNLEAGLGETLQKEAICPSTVSAKGDLTTESGHSSNKEEEKAEVKFRKQLISDINRSEITKISSPKGTRESYESKPPDQVFSSPAAVEACSAEKGPVKEETKSTSLVQEVNAGFPLTDAPGWLDTGGLKMQRDHTCVVGELRKVNDEKETQSPTASFKCSEEKCEAKEELTCAQRKDLEINMCNSLMMQDQASLTAVKSSERKESSQLECEKEWKTSVSEDLDKTNTLVVTQSHENDTNGKSKIDKCGSHIGNIPLIQISTIDDIPDVQKIMPDLGPSEHFIIPKIEIMGPELKECTLPLSILAQNKPETYNLQNHDAFDESTTVIKNQSMADFPGLFPVPQGMKNNNDLPPTEQVKEVAQEAFELPKEHVKRDQLPATEHASIPVISISCSEDLESIVFSKSNNSCVERASETPRESLFVVPPISVTCPESDPEPELSAPSERLETETSASTQRGTKQGVEANTMAKSEITLRGQNFEETSEKTAKENVPPVQKEAATPKVGGNVPTFSKPAEDNSAPEISRPKPIKDAKRENPSSVEDFLKNRPSVERLSSKPPTYPSLSPASLRKFMSKAAQDSDENAASAPAISVDDRQSDKLDEDLSGGSTPTSSLSCESSPRLKRRDSLTLIRSATPEELASGARRKIFIPRSKEDIDGVVIGGLDGKKDVPYMSPSQARRAALLQASIGQKTPPLERRSPLLSRRKTTLEVPKVGDEPPAGEPDGIKEEEKQSGKKIDPLKAPQVIRKIRGEPFPDASGHLKLWCQFFNVLSDSTIKWFKDEKEILEVKKSGGDENQVALAVVLASSQDCGVYGCMINNEHGSDTTDFLLSEDILSGILLKDDLEVGEEIEMTPLLFTKGLADSGTWGEKYFGRIFTEMLHIGEGCNHKTSRVKVIYGLDPIFESGSTCIIKIHNPIAYGTKLENNLAERNMSISKQECKIQNMIREYCKIFAAEARVNENFGFSLEVIPQYLIYRPANSVPYATVEADLTGVFVKYCSVDPKGKLTSQNTSELEQKCSTFQHWIHQWTHGNLLVTHLEGVETKIANVKVVTKSKGYQGLTESGSPEVFDQFLTYHQCNYYCGLLGLRPLKTADLQPPTKIKGSKSPLLNRRMSSSSPQAQRKGHSPQMSRKNNSSPKLAKKVQEPEDSNAGDKPKPVETLSVPEIR
ncbi:alpha-protein kinase 3 isoform X2 [Nothobranchius furzeri]|uniref:non-specific serine/threonine protein kinase n=1 Tax=Nothobranchius furzeri TaxID=105023 RepID=A0A9D3BVT9_NOTFU|nr:titin homolog [Nothobranchius furzeri]XP_054589063.1 titin homolog [Nothobranchius furzeri]KAF7224452.1 transcript variant X2 [Nothobranchius furzeri]